MITNPIVNSTVELIGLKPLFTVVLSKWKHEAFICCFDGCFLFCLSTFWFKSGCYLAHTEAKHMFTLLSWWHNHFQCWSGSKLPPSGSAQIIWCALISDSSCACSPMYIGCEVCAWALTIVTLCNLNSHTVGWGTSCLQSHLCVDVCIVLPTAWANGSCEVTNSGRHPLPSWPVKEDLCTLWTCHRPPTILGPVVLAGLH